MKKKLKVFHGLVNYGTQAGLFAKELRKQKASAISVTYADSFKRQTDQTLLSGGCFFQKIVKHIWNNMFKLFCFFKYNIFHFYYGKSLFPHQLDLPLYRLFGKKVVLHYLGNEVQGYKESVEKYKWTNMPGFLGDKDPIQYDNTIKKRLQFESKYANLQLVCAPTYAEFVPKSIVHPLAIELTEYSYSVHPQNAIPIIMHAPTDRGFKGTDYICEAINKLIDNGYSLKFVIIEKVSHQELKKKIIECDLFIDQIMSGWYGTVAIEAMALGRPVICSLRPSYFDSVEYDDIDLPIMHADPDCIYDTIKNVLERKEELAQMGKKSREFVEEHHDVVRLTSKLIEYYNHQLCVE